MIDIVVSLRGDADVRQLLGGLVWAGVPSGSDPWTWRIRASTGCPVSAHPFGWGTDPTRIHDVAARLLTSAREDVVAGRTVRFALAEAPRADALFAVWGQPTPGLFRALRRGLEGWAAGASPRHLLGLTGTGGGGVIVLPRPRWVIGERAGEDGFLRTAVDGIVAPDEPVGGTVDARRAATAALDLLAREREGVEEALAAGTAFVARIGLPEWEGGEAPEPERTIPVEPTGIVEPTEGDLPVEARFADRIPDGPVVVVRASVRLYDPEAVRAGIDEAVRGLAKPIVLDTCPPGWGWTLDPRASIDLRVFARTREDAAAAAAWLDEHRDRLAEEIGNRLFVPSGTDILAVDVARSGVPADPADVFSRFPRVDGPRTRPPKPSFFDAAALRSAVQAALSGKDAEGPGGKSRRVE